MTTYNGYTNADLLHTVKESDKLKEAYLKSNIDLHISQLVSEKDPIKKAYDYYLGIRNTEELRHITYNYGIGNPTNPNVPHMRLIASAINYFIGRQLQNQLDYHVTCSSPYMINYKLELKKKAMLEDIKNEMLKNAELFSSGKIETLLPKDFLEDLRLKYDESWQADFEVAVHDYLKYYIEKKELTEKFKEQFKDIFIAGETINRIFVREIGKDPEYWYCDPRNVFYEPNPSSFWIKDSPRLVYRRFMSPISILAEIGHYLTKEEYHQIAETIFSYFNNFLQSEWTVFSREDFINMDIAIGSRALNVFNQIEVYHVEWVSVNEYENVFIENKIGVTNKINGKTTNKKDVIQNRYEGYKINVGDGIYCGMGKSKYIERTVENPNKAQLTYSGFCYNRHERMYNGKKYVNGFSIVLATKDINDMYDIAHYHLNNLYAVARPGGTIEVLEYIPTHWGDTPEERMMKSAAYEKVLSKKLISISQEGAEGAYSFNNFGSYPSNLDANLVQALQEYILILRNQAYSLLGINERMLGEVEARDGKSVTAQAVNQGELITKEYFHLISLFIKETLTRIINAARLSFKDADYTNAYMIGNAQRVFTLKADIMSMSDFNVFITDSATERDILAKSDNILQLAIQTQVADLKTAFNSIITNSISQRKKIIERAVNNNQMQLLRQMEELKKAYEDAMKENEKLKKQLETKTDNKEVEMKELEIKKEELNLMKEELRIKEQMMKDKKELEKAKIQAEILQLYDESKNNDIINKSRLK